MEDSDVIDLFVKYLRERGYPDIHVDERPDKKNRTSKDIDAIAGPFAIEHTSIDFLPEQRLFSDWFEKAVGGLEHELSQKVSYRLRISVEYEAIKKGQDWGKIFQAIKYWIIYKSSDLTDGYHILYDIPGLPFTIHITKLCKRPSGVFFKRILPLDDTLPSRLKKKFDEKAKKLEKYSSNKITVLLIEDHTHPTMGELMIRQIILEAYPTNLPHGVAQIWYADTSILSEVEFKLLFSK